MSTSDHSDSPRCETSSRKKLFDLPQLPLRLNKQPISVLIPGAEILPDNIGRYTTKFLGSETEIDPEKASSRNASCVSPLLSVAMESEPETLFPNQLFIRSDVSKDQNKSLVPDRFPSDNEEIHCSSEMSIRPKRRNHRQEETRFSDVIGHAAVKLRIDELILPLGLPSIIADSVLKGIRSIPASILLYGPPGCGKTKLARAIAGEARSAFINVAPSDVLSKFVGESEASIRDIFRKAVGEALLCSTKSTVIFFDEIDALGQSRESSSTSEGDGCSRRVLSELLLLLNVVADNRQCSLKDFTPSTAANKSTGEDDDHTSSQLLPDTEEKSVHIIVVAATNRIEDCDSALLRRFGIQLEVGLPARKDRKKMLIRHLNDIDHNLADNELQNLASMTEQWSGSALENLAREACMCPIRECLHRAAVIRRRTEKREQQTGDVSGQRDGPESPDVAANSCLLESFQRLRPVTFDDFQRAICTLTGGEIAPTMSTRFNKAKKPKRQEHYDSSSASSDDEY